MDDGVERNDQSRVPEGERKITVRDKRRVRPDSEVPTPEEERPSVEPESEDFPADAGPGEGEQVDEVARAREEAASHLEDLRRLKAEFENYRKRVLREQTEIVERASIGLVHRLLNVLDNFELAVAAAEDSRDFNRMLKGVEMVFGELKEVLRTEGLHPIEATGRHFDPNLHEAALEVPGEGDEPIVAEVLRPGYLFKNRVLRPAMVKVARGRTDGNEAGGGGGEG